MLYTHDSKDCISEWDIEKACIVRTLDPGYTSGSILSDGRFVPLRFLPVVDSLAANEDNQPQTQADSSASTSSTSLSENRQIWALDHRENWITVNGRKMAGSLDNSAENFISAFTEMVDRFEEIEQVFKAPRDSKTIDNTEAIFRKAKEDGRLVIKAMQEFRVKLSFANISEPANIAKPSFMTTRKEYKPRSITGGTMSRATSTSSTPQRRAVGFATGDGDDDLPRSTPGPPSTPGSITSRKPDQLLGDYWFSCGRTMTFSNEETGFTVLYFTGKDSF
ncbi:hypothetical protein K470DRAFT_257903 [Piedraia hortae CBS 480.64]|uniref:Uncharacterized protein n=1 Tax=Piedraia hortae CBS 480.64 TaxID=1314780 RepID=A0A6A7C0D6_9PEZI|nr:hypothetical protein K470DRAFT_257902 [Piedraia hortae CBS 480.64]KAF2860460.1 hypothetical protein K470DRAFT_257903 [Piedraia hortae CBS 480.64]